MTSDVDEPGRFRRAVRAFRGWRHARPFWGGLLVTLGGLEILVSERAPLPVIVHIGLQGLAGYLTPLVLVLCGLLLLFHPVQRTFYSLLAIVLSLGSWLTSNLGGFFVGMLLGLIGGALAFAWVRREHPAPARPPASQPPAGKPPASKAPAGKPQPPRHARSAGLAIIRGDRDRRGDGQATGARRRSGGTGASRSGSPASPSGSPASPSGSPASPSGSPAILAMPLAPLALSMLAAVVSRGLLTGSPPLAPLAPLVPPVATPLVTTPLDATPLVATPSVSPVPSQTTVPAPRPSPEPSASPSKPARHPKATTSGPAEAVAADQFSLSSRFASLTGLTYDGIAAVPTAHGTRTMLKFTMQSLRLPGMVLTVTQGGRSFVTSDSAMEFTGNVEFYTTKLTGLLGGVKVTFTSAKPPSDLPANLTLTGVTAEQPFATADLMQAAGSQASAVQAEGGVTSS